MRERRLLTQGSPCDVNFHAGGPATVAEAVARGPDRCPYYDRCGAGKLLDAVNGAQCILQYGVAAIQMMHLEKSRFVTQIEKFRDLHPTPPKGFIWSPDRRRFELIEDFDTAVEKLREFGLALMTGPDSRPTADLNQVVGAALTPDGAISLQAMDEHAGNFGYNGGQGCDVLEGPCACGAGHGDGDKNDRF